MSFYRRNRKSDRKNMKIYVNYLTQIGDSSPDMEKLIAISDLFDISLDELVMGKEASNQKEWTERLLTSDNRKKAKQGLKIAVIIFGVIVLIDIISLIVYISLYGFPQ